MQRRPLALLTLLGIAALTGCATQDRRPIGRIVHETLNEQADAWNRGDINAFMQPYWHSDQLTFSSGGQTHHGWQTTLDRYKRRYPDRAAMGTLTFDIDRIHALDDHAALVLGRWHLTRESPIGGNFSLVFERIDDRWWIIHDHTSVLEPDEHADD